MKAPPLATPTGTTRQPLVGRPVSTPVRVVLFDLDDTLFDHLGTARAALAVTRHEQPALHAADLDALCQHYGELLEELHAQLLAGRYTVEQARQLRFERLLAPYGLSAAQAQQVAARHYAHYRRLRRPLAGALALLRAVAPVCRIGIVTNNRRAEQQDKLAQLGLQPYVSELITSEEVGVAKPAARIFYEALTRFRVPAAQAVMVGDNWQADVVGATQVGIRPVWLNRTGQLAPWPEVAQFTSLEPLTAVLPVLLGIPTPSAAIAETARQSSTLTS